MLQNLDDNADRTFSYVEQAFFQRWVEEASPAQSAAMAAAVASGQMVFLNGAWAMHDEASPSYVDMIDNTALGHRLIAEQFGVAALPTATWQIVRSLRTARTPAAPANATQRLTHPRPPRRAQQDPFGHSATQASVLSSGLAGFDALFFGRMDYQDRAARQATASLEMIWRASRSTGAATQVFTGAMNGYGPPDGRLCWDEVQCAQNDPIQDDASLEQYNVDEIVAIAVNAALGYAAYHRNGTDGTSHQIWPMGSDFQYTNARATAPAPVPATATCPNSIARP